MRILERLFANNRAGSERIREGDPEFFTRLARQHSPQYLRIGCADSRVPANEIVGLLPGELFVHRNVANVVAHTDFNCLSVLRFAIDVPRVKHVIVCGHYGCSGVGAVLRGERIGLADNWLRHVQDVSHRHEAELVRIEDAAARSDRLCELNVIAQVINVCVTTIVRDAWARGQPLSVHGWIYGLRDRPLRDLGVTVASHDELEALMERSRSGP